MLKHNISNAMTGTDCGMTRKQRAAGRCEAAVRPHEITPEQGAESTGE